MKYPYIILLHDNIDSWRFLTTSERKTWKICSEILAERFSGGNYYNLVNVAAEKAPLEPVRPDNLKEQPEYIRRAYESAMANYKADLKVHNEHLKKYQRLQQALKSPKQAYYFLLDDGDIEEVEFDLAEDYKY